MELPIAVPVCVQEPITNTNVVIWADGLFITIINNFASFIVGLIFGGTLGFGFAFLIFNNL
jgi:hypothetical protein